MVEGDELEPGCADGALGVAGGLAAAERLRPEERVGRALEPVEEGVARPDVLPEAELSAGHQDTPQLPQRRGRVGDAAEDPSPATSNDPSSAKRLREAFDDLDRHRRALGRSCAAARAVGSGSTASTPFTAGG